MISFQHLIYSGWFSVFIIIFPLLCSFSLYILENVGLFDVFFFLNFIVLFLMQITFSISYSKLFFRANVLILCDTFYRPVWGCIFLDWVLVKRQDVWIIPSSHLGAHNLVDNLLNLHYLSLFLLVFVESQWQEAGQGHHPPHKSYSLDFSRAYIASSSWFDFFFNYWFFVPVRVNKQMLLLIILGIDCSF